MIYVCDNNINRAKSKVICCKMIPSKHKQITSVEHLNKVIYHLVEFVYRYWYIWLLGNLPDRLFAL